MLVTTVGLPKGFVSESKDLLLALIRHLQAEYDVPDKTINATLSLWLTALEQGKIDYPTRMEVKTP